jgi:hypothetical protein
VDHHCTACDEIRFLKHWWKERLHPDAMDTDSGQDRYMCNHCFANDFNLMVPENCSDIPRLSRLFTSPDFPPPFRRERLKAQASAVEIKDEHEKEHEEEHKGENNKEGHTGPQSNPCSTVYSRILHANTQALGQWGLSTDSSNRICISSGPTTQHEFSSLSQHLLSSLPVASFARIHVAF